MPFEGFPFPSHLPSFPFHQAVLHYLQDYCSRFDLDKFIQFRTHVERAEPVPCQLSEQDSTIAMDAVKWHVTTLSGVTNQKTTSVYDAVLVCNG